MAHLFINPEKDTTIFSNPSLIVQNSGRDEILVIEKTVQNYNSPNGLLQNNSSLPSIGRTLIKFDLDDIALQILSGTIQNPQFILNLKTVEAVSVPLSYTIEAWPISQSWEMGVGRTHDEVSDQGASWKFRDGAASNGSLWYYYTESVPTLVSNTSTVCWSGSWSGSWSGHAFGRIDGIFTGSYSSSLGSGSYFSGSLTGSFSGSISGSFSGSVVLNIESSSVQFIPYDNSLIDQSGGGTWYATQTVSIQGGCLDLLAFPTCSVDLTPTSSFNFIDTSSFCGIECTSASYVATQSFLYETSDISMDVTNIARAWICGCIPNEGFVLKHSGECDSFDYGKLKFFSMDTNTIYSPTLEIKWDDSSFNPTGSATQITGSNKVVYVDNLRPVYKYGSIVRFDIFARCKFPTRTFARQSDYLVGEYLPITSYYSIKDAESEEVLIDFDDNFSKISCDYTGNFFILNTQGLPQERYFKIVIKVEQDGLVEFYEDSGVFKISR